MTEVTRAELQPGLLTAAEAACVYDKTDGFCHPRNTNACRCWDAAQAVMKATGLSARAVAWVFKHRKLIEADSSSIKPEVRP